MRTRVFSYTYPTYALVGGDFKTGQRNCTSYKSHELNVTGDYSNIIWEVPMLLQLLPSTAILIDIEQITVGCL